MKLDINKIVWFLLRIFYFLRHWYYKIVKIPYFKVLELLGIGTNYPIYMYADNTKQYVYSLGSGKDTQERNVVAVSVTDSLEHAKNFQNYSRITRWFELKKANKFMQDFGNKDVFRYKRILNLDVNVDILPSIIK